jgi:hypothetical protein
MIELPHDARCSPGRIERMIFAHWRPRPGFLAGGALVELLHAVIEGMNLFGA